MPTEFDIHILTYGPENTDLDADLRRRNEKTRSNEFRLI
jgi:hypothetical protein